jgi:glycosyltransferase involved in cell wall biosynthesis
LKGFVSVNTVTTVHSKVYKKKLFSYKSDRIIAVSKAIKLHLIENFNINPSKIFVISNFVDTKENNITKNKDEIFIEIGLAPGTRLLGYFGRLDINEKGVDILLDALEKVLINIPSVFLILAGDGVDAIKLKDMAIKENLPVRFLGNLDNIWNYLNACEIVILPSRVEPFNLVMIEAGLLGKPVIGADVDGISEIIKDHKTGALFCKENVDDLKDNILELFTDQGLKEKIGKSLNNDVQSMYTSEKIIPQIEDFYNRLIQNV